MTIYRVYRDFDCCNSIVAHLLFESESRSECEDFVQAVLKSDVSKDINRYRIVKSDVADEEELVDDVASSVFI